MSVKAMNDSVNAQIVLESKLAIAHSINNHMNSVVVRRDNPRSPSAKQSKRQCFPMYAFR